MKNTRALVLSALIAAAPLSYAQRGRGGYTQPSVSVRKADANHIAVNAVAILGWREGVRTGAFAGLTFAEAAAKADAAGLAFVAGSNTQKVSSAIAKNLDYNLTPDEIVKVKNRLDELRLHMPAYYVDALPSDDASRRKVFEFAKSLGADMVVGPAEPAAFETLDKLAGEVGVDVAVALKNPKGAVASLDGRSPRLGLSVDVMKPGDTAQLKGRVLAASLHGNPNAVTAFLLELSRQQPPTIQSDWPPTKDGGAKRSEGKPLFFAVDATDAAASAAAYEKEVMPAISWRLEALSRLTTISKPDNLPADVKQRIDAAVPRQALATPKKPRKLLVMDLCINGGYYHSSIPNANLVLELIGKYTHAYTPVFSNDLENLQYPKIKQFDAVFLNGVEGEVFLPPEVIGGLTRFVREGGGVAGLHAATWASTDVPAFGEMMGAQTGAHKYNGEPGTLRVEDTTSPLTKQFTQKSFDFLDEFYHYLPNGPYSREKLHILLSIDPSRTDLPANQYKTRPDNDYGMVWVSTYGKGRVFNCGLGHKPEFYENANMVQMLLGATQFILGDLETDTTPSAKLAK